MLLLAAMISVIGILFSISVASLHLSFATRLSSAAAMSQHPRADTTTGADAAPAAEATRRAQCCRCDGIFRSKFASLIFAENLEIVI